MGDWYVKIAKSQKHNIITFLGYFQTLSTAAEVFRTSSSKTNCREHMQLSKFVYRPMKWQINMF